MIQYKTVTPLLFPRLIPGIIKTHCVNKIPNDSTEGLFLCLTKKKKIRTRLSLIFNYSKRRNAIKYPAI